MKYTKTISSLALLAVALPFGSTAQACAFCSSGNGTGQTGMAVTAGISVMTIIMLAMLGTLYGFMRHLMWREKNPLPDYSELLKATEAPVEGETR